MINVWTKSSFKVYYIIWQTRLVNRRRTKAVIIRTFLPAVVYGCHLLRLVAAASTSLNITAYIVYEDLYKMKGKKRVSVVSPGTLL